VIAPYLKVAYRVLGKDAKARIWDESDQESGSYDDSEWDEVEVDDNNVSGYPNDIVMEGFVATFCKNRQQTPSD